MYVIHDFMIAISIFFCIILYTVAVCHLYVNKIFDFDCSLCCFWDSFVETHLCL